MGKSIKLSSQKDLRVLFYYVQAVKSALGYP
ncbi:hypothetical protein [Yersinia phage vB_YenM_P8]